MVFRRRTALAEATGMMRAYRSEYRLQLQHVAESHSFHQLQYRFLENPFKICNEYQDYRPMYSERVRVRMYYMYHPSGSKYRYSAEKGDCIFK